MTLTPTKLYSYHVENLRAVDAAFERVKRLCHDAIRRRDAGTLGSLRAIQTLLLGVYGEARLAKLLYEPSGFRQADRARVKSAEALIDRWHQAVDVGFQKRFSVRRVNELRRNLPFSARSRYEALQTMLTGDLKPVFELRNKVAHGQWERPFSSGSDTISNSAMRLLRTENVLVLQYKRVLIGTLADLVHDLVLSATAFDRDFDHHYKRIEDTRRDISNRSYEQWERKLRDSYSRGQLLARSSPGAPLDVP